MSDCTRKIGDRTDDAKPLEWTGDVWAPVCPKCDTVMGDLDEHGWLRCAQCRLKAVDR
jgi:tRNA(Ile2) C34 agmatinyltransferase TiaS